MERQVRRPAETELHHIDMMPNLWLELQDLQTAKESHHIAISTNMDKRSQLSASYHVDDEVAVLVSRHANHDISKVLQAGTQSSHCLESFCGGIHLETGNTIFSNNNHYDEQCQYQRIALANALHREIFRDIWGKAAIKWNQGKILRIVG